MRLRFSILSILICFLVMPEQSMSAVSKTQELKVVNFLPLWSPQPQFAGYYMAKEKGIYKKYGINVNIIHGGYSKDVATYLKEGKATFGLMYLTSAIIEHSKGNKLVNIGQIFQSNDILFVAKKKSGIDSIKDFNGKRIAVWRTVLEELTMGFLDKNNIKADIIKINEGVNIFLKGAVDICAVTHYNEYDYIINCGINPDELNLFYIKDYGLDLPEDGIYCLDSTFNVDPELCNNFLKASLEGWEYALSHKDESLQIIRKYQKKEKVIDNKAHTDWMYNAIEKKIKPSDKIVRTGKLLKSDYYNSVNFLMKIKKIKTSPDYNDFYKGYIK